MEGPPLATLGLGAAAAAVAGSGSGSGTGTGTGAGTAAIATAIALHYGPPEALGARVEARAQKRVLHAAHGHETEAQRRLLALQPSRRVVLRSNPRGSRFSLPNAG